MIEKDYYIHLKSLRDNRQIRSFEVHPRYKLIDKFSIHGETIHSIFYIADFEITWLNGSKTVIDIKGMPTEVAKLKRKLFLKTFGDQYNLDWITRYKGDRVDYFQNEKRRKDKKKSKMSGF